MGNLLGGLKVCPGPDEDRKNIFTVKSPFYTAIPAFFLDALEKASVWYMYGSEKPKNYYMQGNYGPVDEFGPKRALSVKGHLPECLNGEFVRVGPNPRWKPVAGYHWFDGDGMLHGLRIKDGNATLVSRYVRTARYMQEEYWGGPKIRKVGTVSDKPFNSHHKEFAEKLFPSE